MRYFIVADVHGFYDEMKAALDAAGFNPETDTLISCGDAIDRGPRPNEVIKFFVNLPHKILIRGNHEDLMDDLMENPYGPLGHDISNGTYNTLIELASKHSKVNYGTKISKMYARYMEWEDLVKYARSEKTYRVYRDLLVDYAEIGKYIFVHGWIPCFEDGTFIGSTLVKEFSYNPDWRKASKKEWNEARWTYGLDATRQEIFEPNKTIVCGHIHASAWHEYYENAAKFENNGIFENENVVALDACTALSKKVNVLVLELD